jgi:hypothetical protein
MLHSITVNDPAIVPISLRDAKPQLVQYNDVSQGIPVSGGKDAGIVLLQRITKDTTSRLLQETKKALEHNDLLLAHSTLERANALHADPVMARQLNEQLTAKEHAIPPTQRNNVLRLQPIGPPARGRGKDN